MKRNSQTQQHSTQYHLTQHNQRDTQTQHRLPQAVRPAKTCGPRPGRHLRTPRTRRPRTRAEQAEVGLVPGTATALRNVPSSPPEIPPVSSASPRPNAARRSRYSPIASNWDHTRVSLYTPRFTDTVRKVFTFLCLNTRFGTGRQQYATVKHLLVSICAFHGDSCKKTSIDVKERLINRLIFVGALLSERLVSDRLRMQFANQRVCDSRYLCGHERRGAGWPRLSGARSAIPRT
jgi:hypothetical protein